MNETEPQNSNPVSGWTKLAIVHSVCMVIFTGFACFVLYQVGTAVKKAGEATEKLAARADSIAAKVEDTAGSAAAVGRSVEKLAQSVEKLAKKVDAANKMASTLKRQGGALTPEEEKVIDQLLREVRASGLRFARGGKDYSALTAYAWLWAKYKILKGSVSTAEDFVTKIGSKELIGDPYEVVLAGGKKKPLSDWLRERLKLLREKKKEP